MPEFELVWREYIATGGPKPSDSEKKSDLLAILPGAIKKDLF